MLNKNTILEINRNVLKRFEPNLNDGTVFLFDMKNEKFWTGNSAVDCFLRFVNGKNTLDDIYNQLLQLFEDYTAEEVISSYELVITGLIEKGFLVIKNEA